MRSPKLKSRGSRPVVIPGPVGYLGRRAICIVRFSLWFYGGTGLGTAYGQDAQEGEAKTEQDQANKNDAKSSEKKGEWLFAPIPISSPAIGSGLEFAVARLFPFNKKDEVSPASTVGVGGVFTNNGSRAIAIGGRLYMKEDRFRVSAGIARREHQLRCLRRRKESRQ